MPNEIPKELLDDIDEFFRPPDRRRRRTNLEHIRQIANLIRLAARLEEAERQP